MALDEPKEDDVVLEAKGFRVVAEKALVESQGGILLDYLTGPFRKGFQIQGKNQGKCAC